MNMVVSLEKSEQQWLSSHEQKLTQAQNLRLMRLE